MFLVAIYKDMKAATAPPAATAAKVPAPKK
jgi:hypothetical protein